MCKSPIISEIVIITTPGGHLSIGVHVRSVKCGIEETPFTAKRLEYNAEVS